VDIGMDVRVWAVGLGVEYVKAALLASGFMAVEDNNFVAPRPVEPVRALLLSWGLSEVASLDDIANI
jgi:hypothetical protein